MSWASKDKAGTRHAEREKVFWEEIAGAKAGWGTTEWQVIHLGGVRSGGQ